MNLIGYLAQSSSGIGVLGAIIGGSAAAAKNYRDHSDGLISTSDAVYDTSKEAAGAGVATVISAAAVGVIGGGLAISIGTALVTAGVAKYAWDRAMVEVDKKLVVIDDLEKAVSN
ncbi:MAG: magnetosome protein MamC [Gammaproteobacteria bacterium]|nr:magnetosome protein MamC [Gammaproteobacteria bacterium]